MIERCEHDSCEFENRLIYCNAEARDSQSAEIVAAVIDEVLFATDDITSELYRYHTDEESGVSQRAFMFTSVEGASRQELQVWLAHKSKSTPYSAELYDIEIARRYSTLAEDGQYWQANRYQLDIYPTGVAFATIRRFYPEITANGLFRPSERTENMTPYDYLQLFEELTAVCSLHDLEQQDKENSFRAANL